MSVQTALRLEHADEVVRKHQTSNLAYCIFPTEVQHKRYNSGPTLRKPSVKLPMVRSGNVE